MKIRQYILLKFLLLNIIISLAILNNAYGQITQTFGVGTHTWVCPANVYELRVQCWGGGSSGSKSDYGGKGGAGGAYVAGNFTVIPDTTYYVFIGGENSDVWFSKTNSEPIIIQDGFLAKRGMNSDNGLFSIGDTIYSGGKSGTYTFGCGKGGGSAAGPLGPGSNGGSSNNVYGGVTSNGGGNGGDGTCYTYQSASSGSAPGGGGGGSVSGSPGRGAPGRIIITYISSCSGIPNSGTVSFTVGNSCGINLLSATGLTSSPGISYQWQESNNNLSFSDITNATSATLTTNSYQDKYYRIRTICNYGGTSYSNVVFSDSPLSVSGTASSNQSICSATAPSAINLTGNNGDIQWQDSTNGSTWSNIQGATSAILSGGQMGNLTTNTYYRAKVTNGNCSSDTSNIISIFVSTPSVAGTASSNQSICSGTAPSDINLFGNNGNIQWQDSVNSSTWSNIQGAISNTLTGGQIGNLSTTRYYRAKVRNGNCSLVYSNIITTTVLNLPNINAGVDQSVCSGEPVTLSGSGGISYSWNRGITNNVSFTPLSTNTYTLTGIGSNGCQNKDDIIINVNPKPTVSIVNNNPSIICKGQSFTLNSLITNSSTFQWKRNGINVLGATYTSITDTLAGGYSLVGTSSSGCVTTSSTIPISVTPLPTVYGGVDQSICKGDSIVLSGSGASNYLWSDNISDGVFFIPDSSTTYEVSVTSNDGCVNYDQVDVEVRFSSRSTINTSSYGPFILNGSTYTQSGSYEQIINNYVGCDSIITLNLEMYYLGFEDVLKNEKIEIYPNPSKEGYYALKTDFFEVEYFKVINSLGQIVIEGQELPKILNMSKYEVGIYYLNVSVKDKFHIIKLIKL